MPSDVDNEIGALVATTRTLVNQAHSLSTRIDLVVEEMRQFSAEVIESRSHDPREGDERRE